MSTVMWSSRPALCSSGIFTGTWIWIKWMNWHFLVWFMVRLSCEWRKPASFALFTSKLHERSAQESRRKETLLDRIFFIQLQLTLPPPLHPHKVTSALCLSRDISETKLSSLPSRGLEAIEKLKAKNTWALKALPSFRSFLHLQSAELTFPSHCCGLKLLKRWRGWVQQSTAFPTVVFFSLCTCPSHTTALRPAVCAGELTGDAQARTSEIKQC